MSTIRTNNILDAAGGNTATINGMTPTAQSLQGFRNRIINGDMRIDQRNNGAAMSTTGGFPVDRFKVFRTSGTFTAQRSTVVPSGFRNSLLYTVGTGASPGATDVGLLQQPIEGFNVADFGFGTSWAITSTLSFWVRSSVTGTFGMSFRNSNADRSYVGSYTINSANTWEYKTITIPGDTSGNWEVGNLTGIILDFDLGVGSSLSTAAGSWQTGNFIGLTGGTKLNATAGATFYITGVQLEAGSVATPFERRPYGTELALCQRYYQQFDYTGQLGSPGSNALAATKYATGDAVIANFSVTAPMRTAPTITSTNTQARCVLSSGIANYTLQYIVCNAAQGVGIIALSNSSYGAGFGWVDAIGLVRLSAEL